MMMERCVHTARSSGVFRDFHVFTDRVVSDCQCYESYCFDKTDSLFKLHFLKIGMSRLNFDYFVWVDADTTFVRNPMNILSALEGSPMHVPLELNLTRLSDYEPDCVAKFLPDVGGEQPAALGRGRRTELEEMYRERGVADDVYVCGSAFWIIHHDAINVLCDLALGFYHDARKRGIHVDIDSSLGYAMQMLAPDPTEHLALNRPDLWCCDYRVTCKDATEAWDWRHPLGGPSSRVRPAILHVPFRQSPEEIAGHRL